MKVNTEKAVLTDKETLNEVLEYLIKNIPIETKKTETEKDLYNIIIGAASSADSIENAANKLDKSYTGRTVRNYLVNNFESFQELEAQINQALKSKLPRRIKKQKHKLAIDINLIPYYGNPSQSEKDYIYRSQAKNGTCSFYAYATIYIIAKTKRMT